MRLNDVGPRPRVEPAVRITAPPGELAAALAARDPRRLRLAGPEQAGAFAGARGGLREHWSVAVSWEPAEGAIAGRRLEVLDTDGGYWLVVPDDPTVELWPTTPTEVFRGICNLFPLADGASMTRRLRPSLRRRLPFFVLALLLFAMSVAALFFSPIVGAVGVLVFGFALANASLRLFHPRSYATDLDEHGFRTYDAMGRPVHDVAWTDVEHLTVFHGNGLGGPGTVIHLAWRCKPAAARRRAPAVGARRHELRRRGVRRRAARPLPRHRADARAVQALGGRGQGEAQFAGRPQPALLRLRLSGRTKRRCPARSRRSWRRPAAVSWLMPCSASWMPRLERCHSAHSSWKRAWATPCHSLCSGATWAASCDSVDSMLAAPAFSWLADRLQLLGGDSDVGHPDCLPGVQI